MSPQQANVVRAELSKHLVWLGLSMAVLIVAAVGSIDGGGGRERAHIHLGQTRVPLPFLCVFRTITGVPCPGCGVTRSVVSLVHGDLRGAAAFNIGGIVFLAGVLFQFPYRGWHLWKLSQGQLIAPHPNLLSRYLAVLVGVLLLQWGWRMLLPLLNVG